MTEEPHKPMAGKLLASSLAAHLAIATLTKEQREQQIAADEALARALEREFELTGKGLTEISQVGASGAPATTAALTSTTAPTISEKKKEMPPSPAPKAPLKRTAPETREEDPAAKRQRTVAAKSGRMERRRRRKEGRRKDAEKEKILKLKRVKIIEGRIESHWNEVRLIQYAITRSSYIPLDRD